MPDSGYDGADGVHNNEADGNIDDVSEGAVLCDGFEKVQDAQLDEAECCDINDAIHPPCYHNASDEWCHEWALFL